jgi:Na+/H+-dicarboxylate symporter
MFKQLLSNTIFQIIIVIVAGYVLTPYMGQEGVTWAYSASSVITTGLILLLPIITFTYMFSSMLKFARSSPGLIISVLTSVQISNVLALAVGFFALKWAAPYFLTAGSICLNQTTNIHSYVNIPIPSFWSPSNGMLFGFVLGIIFSFIKSSGVLRLSENLKSVIGAILSRVLIPVLPLFIFGFFVKMRFEGTIEALTAGYSKVFIFVTLLLFGYMAILLIIAHGFNMRSAWRHVKCMITPLLTGFTTMSSMATMPFTLTCTKEALEDDDYSDFIIPFTNGIHMIGDGIIFGVTIAALIYMYSACEPSLAVLGVFSFYYMLSKFSAAGVPAGTTAIVMPLLGQYLGFSEEMMGVFFSVGILQDCLITTGNVGGNCIFAKLSFNSFRGLMKSRI